MIMPFFRVSILHWSSSPSSCNASSTGLRIKSGMICCLLSNDWMEHPGSLFSLQLIETVIWTIEPWRCCQDSSVKMDRKASWCVPGFHSSKIRSRTSTRVPHFCRATVSRCICVVSRSFREAMVFLNLSPTKKALRLLIPVTLVIT
jgi:hypothetical protein